MCKFINHLNYKKNFNNKKYNYILIDINSLTLVPYLNSEKYQSTDNINITPFIETVKLYNVYKKYFPKAKFIFIIDGGISPTILKICPEYKKNRNSKKYSSKVYNTVSCKNIYDYNVGLLISLFDILGECFISDVRRNEADFVIGYIANSLSKSEKCLVLSHDKDLLFAYNKNNNVDIIYKYINMKYNKVLYYYVDSFDCLLDIIDFRYLKNEIELLYYRSLIGDVSDNIKKPFGLKSKKIVENMFADCYLEDIDITYEYIRDYFSEKFNNKKVLNNFITDFRRNLVIMNIFNADIILPHDKIKLNTYIDNIKYTSTDKIEINSIYALFSKYGLYLEKEHIDNMFKYLKG
jgi:5'-3' exonuclease